jgi:ubiquinone/menaquinone biosynthesis C-methylase UbiE
MASTTQRVRKKRIQAYWSGNPQGSRRVPLREQKEFFANYEKHRYEVEPFIPRIAGFERSQGKRVLEVGCGVGTDLRQFAKNGASVTGLDLSHRSAKLAALSLRLFGLEGDIVVGDAELLPFRSETFDQAYSYGVLHHTPHTLQAIRELYRVLTNYGNATVMLYHKYSLPLVWILLRYGLLRGEALGKDVNQLITDHSEDAGWSPLTKFYTRDQALSMFNEFSRVDLELTHIPRLSGFPLRMISVFQSLIGFYLIINASKQSYSRKPFLCDGQGEHATRLQTYDRPE